MPLLPSCKGGIIVHGKSGDMIGSTYSRPKIEVGHRIGKKGEEMYDNFLEWYYSRSQDT